MHAGSESNTYVHTNDCITYLSTMKGIKSEPLAVAGWIRRTVPVVKLKNDVK